VINVEDERLTQAALLEKQARELRREVENDKCATIRALLNEAKAQAEKLKEGPSLYQGDHWSQKDELLRSIDGAINSCHN